MQLFTVANLPSDTRMISPALKDSSLSSAASKSYSALAFRGSR